MNSRWNVLFLILAASICIIFFATVFACGDDDDDDDELDEVDDDDDNAEDDDDSTDDDDATGDDDDVTDDDDDDPTPDCTVSELCTHLITDCLFESDQQTCEDNTLADCKDEVGYQACACDCMDEFSGTDEAVCGEFIDCAFNACWLGYCG